MTLKEHVRNATYLARIKLALSTPYSYAWRLCKLTIWSSSSYENHRLTQRYVSFALGRVQRKNDRAETHRQNEALLCVSPKSLDSTYLTSERSDDGPINGGRD